MNMSMIFQVEEGDKYLKNASILAMIFTAFYLLASVFNSMADLHLAVMPACYLVMFLVYAIFCWMCAIRVQLMQGNPLWGNVLLVAALCLAVLLPFWTPVFALVSFIAGLMDG